MKIILTVTGHDHVGIVSAVTSELTRRNVNIVNISQTLMEEHFTMILKGEFDDSQQTIQDLQAAFEPVAAEQKVRIRIQSEAIFDAMHTI